MHQGQGGFPPDRDRFSSFWVSGVHANKVVRVHASMDETIEGNSQINITIVKDVRVEPVEQKDGSVMVDMKEGKLSPLFTQHNKDGVPEIPNLGNVEQPQKISHSRIILAVSNAWSHGIPVAVRQEYCFNRHVSTQHDLRNIVEELDWVRVNGRPILHDLRANDDEQNVYKCNAECRCKICQPPTLKMTNEIRIKSRLTTTTKIVSFKSFWM